MEYNKKKLLLAFEAGIILSETAKTKRKKITPVVVKKMEEIIVKEFSKKTPQKLATEMQVNILAAFETK